MKGHRLFQRGERSRIWNEHRLSLLEGGDLHPPIQPSAPCNLVAKRQHRGKQFTRLSHILGVRKGFWVSKQRPTEQAQDKGCFIGDAWEHEKIAIEKGDRFQKRIIKRVFLHSCPALAQKPGVAPLIQAVCAGTRPLFLVVRERRGDMSE